MYAWVRCASGYLKRLLMRIPSDLLDQYGVRLNVVGDKKLLPESLQQAVQRAEDMTRHNKK